MAVRKEKPTLDGRRRNLVMRSFQGHVPLRSLPSTRSWGCDITWRHPGFAFLRNLLKLPIISQGYSKFREIRKCYYPSTKKIPDKNWLASGEIHKIRSPSPGASISHIKPWTQPLPVFFFRRSNSRECIMPSNQNKVIVLRHKKSRTSDRVRLTKYSKNKKIQGKVDSRIKSGWRLRVMGSWQDRA